MTDQRSLSDPIGSAMADYDDLRYVTEESPCAYLPGLPARAQAYRVDSLAPATHQRLMGLGFRRSGNVVYRAHCRTCDKCQAIRVVVTRLVLTPSMRRVARLNRDVAVDVSTPVATDEKYEMFRRYLDAQHDGSMSRDRDVFTDFLYTSPTRTLEFSYKVKDRLVAVGIVDQCPSGLSSVYVFFDPSENSRSLGTLSVLREVEYCRRRGLPYYYLGLWVEGSKTMDYKARFRPNEILTGDGCWVPFRE